MTGAENRAMIAVASVTGPLQHSCSAERASFQRAMLVHDIRNLIFSMTAKLNRLSADPLAATWNEDLDSIAATVEYLRCLDKVAAKTCNSEQSTDSPRHTVLSEWWQHAQPVIRMLVPSGVEFHSNLIDCPHAIRIDSNALLQAVLNLVHNAVEVLQKNAGAHLIIWAAKTETQVKIAVIDNGPGIPDKMKRQLHDRADRLTSKPDADSHGYGLCIVREVVEKAGGRLRIHSSPRRGTICRMLLPSAE